MCVKLDVFWYQNDDDDDEEEEEEEEEEDHCDEDGNLFMYWFYHIYKIRMFKTTVYS